jgi:hypothetical protein
MISTIMKRLNRIFGLGLLGFLFVLGACNKPGDLKFTIEGQVFDKSFNQNLQQATVRLFRVPIATTQEVLIAEETVSNGTYSFTFERDMSERYIVRFEKENYFNEINEVFFSQLQVGLPYQLNFNVEAIAVMNWVLVDQTPNNSNNSVIIQKLESRAVGAGTCPNQQYEFFGGQGNDTLRCAVGGNQYVKFYKVQLPNFQLDSVYCPAFEETFYIVNY